MGHNINATERESQDRWRLLTQMAFEVPSCLAYAEFAYISVVCVQTTEIPMDVLRERPESL